MMHFLQADATKLPFADDSFDLVFSSPPYVDCRLYLEAGEDPGISRDAHEWVEWMLKVTDEAVRVSKGLVIFIAAGCTRDWNYWPACEGLMWEWFKRGGQAWRPAYWHRVGIPGSGGAQWLRADVEYALCFTKCPGEIPWSDNTINGHPPKWAPGGEMSHRLTDGQRINQWGKTGSLTGHVGGKGEKPGRGKPRPSHQTTTMAEAKQNDLMAVRRCTRGKSGGDTTQEDMYVPPVLANPGVLVDIEETADELLARWIATVGPEAASAILGIKVGGGLMGHHLAHVNEAPFPERLATWFIEGWCPPGGTVCDIFGGSGTTAAAAVKLGRKAVSCDIRYSQCELARRRCADAQPPLF